MRVLTGSLLLLFAFLRFDHSVQLPIFVIYRQVLKDSALVLVIMNQWSYQIERSINDYQCPARLTICKLHLIFIFGLLAFFLFSIRLRGVVIEIFKFFVNTCSNILADMRISLVLNKWFLAHYTAHSV